MNWLALAMALAMPQAWAARSPAKEIPRQARQMADLRRRQNAQLKAMHSAHRKAVAAVRADPALSRADRRIRIEAMDAEFKAARRAAREKFKAERMALRKASS